MLLVLPFCQCLRGRQIAHWAFWRLVQLGLAALVMLLVLGGAIGLRLAWSTVQVPEPEVMIVLGGDFEREYFAAYFAQTHPNLPIWISSGMPEAKSRAYFAQVGVDLQRVIYDQQAVSTLTNFTTLLPRLKHAKFRHAYVITSDFHQARSRSIAYWIWGSRGIATQFVLVSTRTPPEPGWLILGDTVRSLLWLFTGQVFSLN